MNSTLTIARRELIEKRFVFVTAAAFLALALIVPFMPGVHEGERVGALLIGSLTLATALSVGLSSILGTSIVGRDLADGRLSFYFSKPVPSLSIWFGKLIAAAILIFGSFVIVGFPGLLAGGAAAMNTWTGRAGDSFSIIEAILVAAAALFLVCHVIGTFVRSRSVWIVFDFVAAIVCGAAIWLLGRQLLAGLAVRLTTRLAWIFAAFAAVAIVAAGAWQVARGRTDRKRSHLELSRFLWMSLGCGLLAVTAFVMWVVSATPRDVTVPDLARQSAGRWAFLGGQTKNRIDYRVTFLYNVDDGRFVRLSGVHPWWLALLSQDGKVACWLVESKDVWIARLDSPDPRPVQTRITLDAARSFNISSDGSKLASVDRQGILSVDDLRSGNSLGSARIPGATGGLMEFFARPDLVRIYAFSWGPNASQPVMVYEYDLAQKTLTSTGRLPRGTPRLSHDFSRAIVLSGDGLEIRDARTGAVQQTIAGGFINAKFLRDGRIAAIGRDRKVLTLFSSNGMASRVIALPNMSLDSIFEPEGGPLVACSSHGGCAVLDIARGAVMRTEPGIYPATNTSTGPRLLSYTRQGVIIWTPATGEKRPIG